MFQVEAGKQSPEKASARLDALYRESLDDPAASEMGSAMVGVTYSARNSTVAPAMGLFGMLIGALLTGGSGGMLIGGLVGWGIGKVSETKKTDSQETRHVNSQTAVDQLPGASRDVHR